MRVEINVQKATPTITWANPADITYGTALGDTQLNATVTGTGPSPTGALTYTPAAGTILDANPDQTLHVDVAATSNYNAASQDVSINVLKADQTITWVNPADIVYGTALGDTQLNATVTGTGPSPTGALTYTPAAGTILDANPDQTLHVDVAATSNYNAASQDVSINVLKADQTITWVNPADIVYGTALGDTQLNATVTGTGPSPTGALTYTPAAGTILDANPDQTLHVDVAATSNYNAASQDVSINVLKADQTITWVNPADIVYGTALGGTQLNATVSVGGPDMTTGALTYTPAAGTILDANPDQTLHVDVAATSNYNAASQDVSINVLKADQTITWVNPADIVYGTALGGTQLNATVSVGGPDMTTGALTYTPAAGTILDANPDQTLHVDVAATSNYNAASQDVSINVLKADQTITWVNPADIVYGTALGDTQLNATVTGTGPSPTGALTYTPAAGTILDANPDQTLHVDVAATSNYNAASQDVSINVLKADQTITWVNPADIVYGTALGDTQLNATVTGTGPSPTGALTYTPAAGTILDANPDQTLHVDVAATSNYNAASQDVSINVLKADQTITWVNPADIVYGTALGGTQLNATVSVGGPDMTTGALTYTPAAGTILDANPDQTLHVDVAATSNYNAASQDVSINVLKADQTITWVNPADIVYGTALGGTQLNATVSVGGPDMTTGALTYTPAAGTILDANPDQTLHVDVAATSNYNAASQDVSINVLKADQTITWVNPADIVYGTALGDTQLNATVTGTGPSPTGALTYTPAAGTILDANPDQTLHVDVAATSNYNAASQDVSINVLQATPMFSNLTPSQTIVRHDTQSIELAGTLLSSPTASPVDQDVTITIKALVATTAKVKADGSFTATIDKASLPLLPGTYVIVYAYAGDANFHSAINSSTKLTVQLV